MIPKAVLAIALIFVAIIVVMSLGVSLAIYGMVKEMTKLEQNDVEKDE